jgi:hypothetical protein
MSVETVDFGAERKAAEAAGLLSSGDYLKIKEGDNRIRLMSRCLPHDGEYKGKRNFKWLCYVLDRVDGRIKPFFMPHTIYKKIEALQTNDDYAFSSVPMPYDLTINAKGAGTKEVEYSLIPARRETPLTAHEQSALLEMKPLGELQAALKEKDAKQPQQHDEHDQREQLYDDDGRPIPF